MSDIEEWRAVVGFEGQYEVSNHGRVRSLFRVMDSGRHQSGRILKQSMSNGYRYVGLVHLDCSQKVARIHVLVAQAFIGERPKGLVINHIDHDKTNNHATNIEYVTHKENIQHAARNGRMGQLAMAEVQAIRSLVSRDPSVDLDVLAAKLGVATYVVLGVVEASHYTLIPNKDGSMPVPLPTTHGKTMEVEDIADLQTLGFSIPEIGRFYKVEYSAPYQALRRAGVWQEHSKTSTRGSGRRASKRHAEIAAD